MKQPVRITITGAAGNLGYAMAFRIAAGDMLGKDQPIILHLLEITPALTALEGVVMELKDCAFPLLKGVIATDDLAIAFKDTNYALLAGARPRGPGMERKDLLEANGAIFGPQGQALDQYADRNVRVLVVGNPANTNALIVMKNAPSLNYNQFTAMTRLDHNRAQALLAEQTKTHVNDIKKVTIWGNHSSTQYPDLSQTTIKGASALAMVDRKWYEEQYITDVQQRGAAIIKARGVSSAASGASAAIDHMRSWVLGTEAGNWVSMGVPADGSYGIKEGVIFSYPCICVDGHYKIVKGLTIDSFSQAKLDITEKELREEAEAVKTLLGS